MTKKKIGFLVWGQNINEELNLISIDHYENN
jgi:hypothetical protein